MLNVNNGTVQRHEDHHKNVIEVKWDLEIWGDKWIDAAMKLPGVKSDVEESNVRYKNVRYGNPKDK